MAKLSFEVEKHFIRGDNGHTGLIKLIPEVEPDGSLVLDKMQTSDDLALVVNPDEAFCFSFGRNIIRIIAFCKPSINENSISGIDVNRQSILFERGLKYYLGKGMILDLTGIRQSGVGINYKIRCSE